MIKEAIEKAHKDGKMTIDPMVLAAYTYSMQQALVRQWTERDDYQEWSRPSGLNCPRKKAAIKHGVVDAPGTDKFGYDTITKFFIGDVYESTVVTLAAMAGVKIYHSLNSQLEISTPFGLGHPDGFLDPCEFEIRNNLPITFNEILEIKSMNPWSFKSFKKVTCMEELDDTFGYRSQACLYMAGAMEAGLLAPDGKMRYLVVNKETMAIEERLFDIDHSLVRKRSNDWAIINDSTSPFEVDGLPPEPYGSGFRAPVQCRYGCQIPEKCWKDRGYTIKKVGANWMLEHD